MGNAQPVSQAAIMEDMLLRTRQNDDLLSGGKGLEADGTGPVGLLDYCWRCFYGLGDVYGAWVLGAAAAEDAEEEDYEWG